MSEESQTVTTSRRVLLAGVGAVGAAAVLTACSSGDPAGGGSDAANTAPTGPAEEPGGDSGDSGGGQVVGKASDVPVGGGALFPASQMVVTQPTEGKFHGFRAVCTHQGCPIASVDGGTINCSCHGSKFSLDDGTPRNGPATRALTARDVTVQGDNIVLA